MIFHFISKTYVILLKLYNFHDFPCYYMCPHTTGSQSKKKKKSTQKKEANKWYDYGIGYLS